MAQGKFKLKSSKKKDNLHKNKTQKLKRQTAAPSKKANVIHFQKVQKSLTKAINHKAEQVLMSRSSQLEGKTFRVLGKAEPSKLAANKPSTSAGKPKKAADQRRKSAGRK